MTTCCDTVARALRESGLPPAQLEVEITEGVLLANNARSNAMMNQFVEMGVHLAMDDFGTGYSSMSYLTKFRFNKIKIDRSFVQALDRGGEAIILAIVGMTRSLGIKSCAEGIETEEQMAALRVMGIDEVQGYLFGKPMPRPELIERFRLGRETATQAARRRLSPTPYGVCSCSQDALHARTQQLGARSAAHVRASEGCQSAAQGGGQANRAGAVAAAAGRADPAARQHRRAAAGPSGPVGSVGHQWKWRLWSWLRTLTCTAVGSEGETDTGLPHRRLSVASKGRAARSHPLRGGSGGGGLAGRARTGGAMAGRALPR